MNLATRCTTCGTIFRVVQDQLRVSEGWVRCGRCAEVFDARQQLFDLEKDSPPPWPPQPGAEPTPSRPVPLPAPPAPVQAQPPVQPPYPTHQAQTLATQAARSPTTSPAPMYAPEPAPMARAPVAPPTFPTQSMSAAFDDVPRRFAPIAAPVEPVHDSNWIPNDDHELNPFAPPRHLDEEDGLLDEGELHPSPRQYSRPRHRPAPPSRPHPSTYAESSYDEDRLEPFLAPPTPPAPPDPRSHLPEPRGMRFEEDDLPPPIPDDERPDVLLALSPATAAQLKSQEPALDPNIPVRAPRDDGEPSMMPGAEAGVPMSRAERKAAEKAAAKEAAEAAKQAKLDEKAADKAAKEAEKEAVRAAKEAEKLAKETEKAAEKAAKAEARIKGQQAAAATAAAASNVPSFVRKAESAQRWHRPWVRATLGAATLGLLLGLGGQGVWQAREAIAAQYPFAKPMLMQVTTAMGKDLKPWQHIEALSVESSSLNPAGEGNHYRLTLSLRNRSNWEVAQPWVDLSLTDAAGQLVVRRMLSPEELRASATSMTAGSDQQLQVVFDSGATKISGYTVELFYP